MCRILHISKFLVPAKNSQCIEFYTLDEAGTRSNITFIPMRCSLSSKNEDPKNLELMKSDGFFKP